MKPVKLIKIAASTLVLGVGFMGVAPAGLSTIAAASDRTPQAKAGAAAYGKAVRALKKQKFNAALMHAEKAVAFAPDQANYRFALGQAYLGLGRMSSAETAFGEVLTLDPSNSRAGLHRALMQIALGRPENALATLDEHRESLAAADFGLAVALAGDTSGAVKVLEAAVRGPGADVKTRQNLALAYALDGQWAQARVTAALDMAPDQIDARMTEWAHFARPTSSSDQVASLMRIRPVYDPGQPERLALILKHKETATVAYVQQTPSEAPVAKPMASAEPVPSFEVAKDAVAVPVAAPAPLIEALVEPAKQMVVPVAKSEADSRPARAVESGRFVVQLGAFSNKGRAQIAWNRAAGRTRQLEDFGASTARVHVKGASLYRLSVSGFATRDDAARVCTRVKASGGECFVRSIAGDRPMQWVSRGGTRLAVRR